MNDTAQLHRVDYDVEAYRRDFPILGEIVHGQPLVYLDSAASAQKPRQVIDAVSNVYEHQYANVHRGVHYMSERTTDAYEGARIKVREFLNAKHNHEIIFTRNTTEAINMVAQTHGRRFLEAGDEILISIMEHHSNIVPWQMLCEEKGANLLVVPIDDSGELVMDEYEKMLSPRTKLVSITHVSNALGTILPVAEIIEMAHAHGVPVLLDGAQAVPHMPVDMKELDVDFYVFSGHKLYGPTGIGILYGKAEHLEAMPPFLGGGEMIKSVTFEKTIYNDLPYKFEGGTPDIAGAIGLGAAIDYVNDLGFDQITAHEEELLRYGTDALSSIEGLRIIGTAAHKAGILSFVMDKAHPHDIGTILDEQGIAVRTGHHCAQPVMQRFQIPATARASLAFYNTKEEIDALVKGIDQVLEVFS